MTEDKNTSFLNNLLNVSIEAANPNFVALNENFLDRSMVRQLLWARAKLLA